MLNSFFLTKEEFKTILTKYPKKHLMWIVSKRDIVSEGVIATLTTIYSSPNTAIPGPILKCYPPILQQRLSSLAVDFDIVSIVRCLKTDTNLITVLLWSSFGMLGTIQFSWKLYIEYKIDKWNT